MAAGTDLGFARSLHDRVHEVCFIARSVRFPVDGAPTFFVENDADVERSRGRDETDGPPAT